MDFDFRCFLEHPRGQADADAEIYKTISLADPEDKDAVQTLINEWVVDDFLGGKENSKEILRQS